jgi:uncharacterized protein (DUF427 family)
MRPKPDPVTPGQESVWRYPRPAVAENSRRRIRIEHRGVLIADTRSAVRTLETSHPPSWYLPLVDLTPGLLRRSERRSFCEWKGQAVYWHLAIGDALLRDVAWSYPEPTPAFAALRDHLAFYAGPLDRCTVDGERVAPQPGDFYGGWITADLAGPFKGVPGSMGW